MGQVSGRLGYGGQLAVPARVIERQGSLPRNPSGKIDRKLLAQELQDLFEPQMNTDSSLSEFTVRTGC